MTDWRDVDWRAHNANANNALTGSSLGASMTGGSSSAGLSGRNLPERLRGAGWTEGADEIERCWNQLKLEEKARADLVAEREQLLAAVAERDAEIKRLHADTDKFAESRGYRAGVSFVLAHLLPVLITIQGGHDGHHHHPADPAPDRDRSDHH